MPGVVVQLWSAKTQEGIFQINVTLLHPEDLEAGAPWDYVNGWEGCTMRVRYLPRRPEVSVWREQEQVEK